MSLFEISVSRSKGRALRGGASDLKFHQTYGLRDAILLPMPPVINVFNIGSTIVCVHMSASLVQVINDSNNDSNNGTIEYGCSLFGLIGSYLCLSKATLCTKEHEEALFWPCMCGVLELHGSPLWLSPVGHPSPLVGTHQRRVL